MTTIFLALSLAVDAFAVSVAQGLSPCFKKIDVVWLALYFGGFQAGMTLLGAFLGSHFSDLVGAFGPWIAFLLLAGIGVQMVRSSRICEEEACSTGLTHRRMLVLALATSIDAAAAGVSLGLQQVGVLYACVVIGLTAGGLSAVGGLAGERVGTGLHKKAELVGGLVLIGLGVRSLIL